MVSMAVSIFPKAVRTIAVGMLPSAPRRFINSKPSMRGIIKSVMITFAGNPPSFSSACCPSSAVSTTKPHDDTMAASGLRWDISSSTIKTLIGGRAVSLATILQFSRSAQFRCAEGLAHLSLQRQYLGKHRCTKDLTGILRLHTGIRFSAYLSAATHGVRDTRGWSRAERYERNSTA